VQAVSGIPPVRTVEAGGRTVGYYEYGDPGGTPCFALHGTPACGAGFDWADAPARERAVRVIAPDRAGVGLSGALSRRLVAGYAEELLTIADAFGFERFAVLGYSGGGPYACAAAHGCGERATAVAVAAGMGQVGVWAQPSDFEATDARLLDLSLRRPFVARAMLRFAAAGAKRFPRQALGSFVKQMGPSDRELIASITGDPHEMMALFTQAFLRGPGGVVDDYAALAQPWGFAVEDIIMPLHVFHGDADTMVPLAHAQALFERVPNATLTVFPDEGHLATIAHIGEILDALVAREC
jgi:pimeloyl-ACP methyl ester carboxylesterase